MTIFLIEITYSFIWDPFVGNMRNILILDRKGLDLLNTLTNIVEKHVYPYTLVLIQAPDVIGT